MNGFQPLQHQVFFIHSLLDSPFTQGIAQRDDRCNGIHDFMCQDTNQFLPCLHFVFFQNGTDILQVDKAQIGCHCGILCDRHRHILHNFFLIYTNHLHFTRLQGSQNKREIRIQVTQFFQLMNGMSTQILNPGPVHPTYFPFFIRNQNTRIYRIKQGFEISMLFLLFRQLGTKLSHYLIDILHHFLLLKILPFSRKTQGKITIANGFNHT